MSSSFASSLPSPPGILLQDVVLQRGATRVFDGLSLALDEARIGLIGDNGAGKSSLFRLLSGLDAPASGQVSVCGVDVKARRDELPGLVGLMFQNPDDQIIFPTVAEELAFSLQARGVHRRQAREQAQAFLANRGLAAWADRAVESLSQGQRQHVCLLALLIAAPRVLLLDEPFASLDLPGQARLDADIHATAQQVVVSTHVLAHVRHFERVLWLDHGRVRADGVGEAVCAAYEADVAARTARGELPA
ncbi:MAG: Biotin transport ATP-binding protein BioM [Paracidovorax wautersii]|uniref:Biotin transport ATP-binding protein BioM n=1 Tax=Paracidovorax wautersii TaxID=1177982 RepID=A0A7V8FLH3_9BURK|nr:MAG: Biotin transport ATP-binding protein BioM [Paracidovorax wautersii]